VIVAEQQEPFAGLIEPSDQRKTRRVRRLPERRIDGRPAAFIASRADQAARLVEHEIARRRRRHCLSVDRQPIPVQTHAARGVTHHPAVHCHAARADSRFGFGP